MKLPSLTVFVFLMLMIAGCTGNAPLDPTRDISVEPLSSTSLDGVTYEVSGDLVTVHFAHANRSGSFIQLNLPEGTAIQDQQWTEKGVIGLVVPTDAGAQIGLVALATYDDSPISVELELVSPEKVASTPPTGSRNELIDFTVTNAGAGQVELTWTQINTGDYDHNTEVNIADLVPLAVFYMAAGPFSVDQPEYWIDGDQNGEITISDITPIGANFLSSVTGYIIRHNGELLPGGMLGQPTVTVDSAEKSGHFLPWIYSIILPGSVTDSWSANALDSEGNEGAGGTWGGSTIDVTANLSITGMNLLDMEGANPGPLAEQFYLARIIDPIEIINSARHDVPAAVAPSTVNGTTASFATVPRDQWLYLDLVYLPEFDLATGNARTPSGLKGSSAVPPEDFVITTVPFQLPGSGGQVNVDAQIDLLNNPLGGYFVDLVTQIAMPGDDPATPVLVENGYTISRTTRLDFLNGIVSSDTDFNGDFDDEAELEDDDRDCASPSRTNQAIDDDEYEDEGDELEIGGVISAFDEATGMITLTGAVLEDGGPALPDPLVLYFSELTRFEEKIKMPGNDIEQDIDPSDLQVGDEVEVELYRLDDSIGPLPDKYWIEKIDRRIDLT